MCFTFTYPVPPRIDKLIWLAEVLLSNEIYGIEQYTRVGAPGLIACQWKD